MEEERKIKTQNSQTTKSLVNNPPTPRRGTFGPMKDSERNPSSALNQKRRSAVIYICMYTIRLSKIYCSVTAVEFGSGKTTFE